MVEISYQHHIEMKIMISHSASKVEFFGHSYVRTYVDVQHTATFPK